MLPNKGISSTQPGEKFEPLWSPLIPEPEPWSEEKRQEMNSGTNNNTETTNIDKALFDMIGEAEDWEGMD